MAAPARGAVAVSFSEVDKLVQSSRFTSLVAAVRRWWPLPGLSTNRSAHVDDCDRCRTARLHVFWRLVVVVADHSLGRFRAYGRAEHD